MRHSANPTVLSGSAAGNWLRLFGRHFLRACTVRGSAKKSDTARVGIRLPHAKASKAAQQADFSVVFKLYPRAPHGAGGSSRTTQKTLGDAGDVIRGTWPNSLI